MSVLFDGVDDCVSCPGSEVGSSTTSFSLYFRMRTTAISGVPFGESNTGNATPLAMFQIVDSGTFKFLLRDDSNVVVASAEQVGSSVFRDGTWHNHIVVGDLTNLVLYRDGVDIASVAYSSSGTITLNTRQIARLLRTSAALYTNCEIGEAAAWGTNLSLADIALLQSKIKGIPLQIQPANLKGYWPLDDLPEGGNLAGATFVDRSGNGNNGTGSDADASGGQGRAETVLSYPAGAIEVISPQVVIPTGQFMSLNTHYW